MAISSSSRNKKKKQAKVNAVSSQRNGDFLNVETGGHWFATLLNRRRVEFVFGTTGAGMPDIQDAMVVVKPPKWIQGLHEFVTVNAASGYALASGKPGVAMIDRSVGTQNCVGAFYGAFMNSAPIVVFASANVPGVPIPTGEIEYHYVASLAQMVNPWVKWSTHLESLDTLPEDVEKAFYMATSEHQGPTFVTLRQDLMASGVSQGRVIEPVSPPAPRVPDDASLKKVLNMIVESDNPVMLVSQAGRHPEVPFLLARLAHRLGIGVVERRVFMNYPMTDGLHLGFDTSYADPSLPDGTDFVLTIEMGLLPHYGFKKGVEVVEFRSDPLGRQDVDSGGDYGSSLYPATLRAVCDTEATVSRMIRMLRRGLTTSDESKIVERISKMQQEHRVMYDEWRKLGESACQKETLNGYSVGHVLNTLWRPNYVWVNGVMTYWTQLVRTIVLDQPASYFGNPSEHLGVDIGLAYGVALANRHYQNVKNTGKYAVGRLSSTDKVVVCTAGDGDAIFGNLGAALWTANHYGLGVLYIVLNNSCWAIEWPPMEHSPKHWASRAGDYEFLDLDNPRTDFAKMASAFGVHSASVQTPSELENALRKALATVAKGQPAVVDVVLEKPTGRRASVVP
jgi:thiamine pyrophosphate-dependent acetolactate synthase large subunit-like protein